MSENYINNNFDVIIEKAHIIENRGRLFSIDKQFLIDENKRYIDNCIKYNLPLLLIDTEYTVNIDL